MEHIDEIKQALINGAVIAGLSYEHSTIEFIATFVQSEFPKMDSKQIFTAFRNYAKDTVTDDLYKLSGRTAYKILKKYSGFY